MSRCSPSSAIVAKWRACSTCSGCRRGLASSMCRADKADTHTCSPKWASTSTVSITRPNCWLGRGNAAQARDFDTPGATCAGCRRDGRAASTPCSIYSHRLGFSRSRPTIALFSRNSLACSNPAALSFGMVAVVTASWRVFFNATGGRRPTALSSHTSGASTGCRVSSQCTPFGRELQAGDRASIGFGFTPPRDSPSYAPTLG